jgi:hypothetical protein
VVEINYLIPPLFNFCYLSPLLVNLGWLLMEVLLSGPAEGSHHMVRYGPHPQAVLGLREHHWS